MAMYAFDLGVSAWDAMWYALRLVTRIDELSGGQTRYGSALKDQRSVDELFTACIQGHITGYGGLSDDSLQLAMLISFTLPAEMGASREAKKTLEMMSKGEPNWWREQNLPGPPPKLPDGDRVEAFTKRLLGNFNTFGSPSQHRGEISGYERGGVYRVVKGVARTPVLREPDTGSDVIRPVAPEDWLKLEKIRSDGWLHVKDKTGGERFSSEPGVQGWINASDLSSLETTAIWLPAQLGFTEEAVREFGRILSKIDTRWMDAN